MGKQQLSSHLGMGGAKSQKSANAKGYSKLAGNAKKKTMKQADAAKAGKILHPHSRKASRLHRSTLRDTKIAGLKRAGDKKRISQGEKLVWFQEHIMQDTDKTVYTAVEACQIIQSYVDRNQEELAELVELDRARGRRTHAARIDHLKLLLKGETTEFVSGTVVPDFTNTKAVKMLKEWQLELNTMAAIPTRIFRQSPLK